MRCALKPSWFSNFRPGRWRTRGASFGTSLNSRRGRRTTICYVSDYTDMNTIVVVDYDPNWPTAFEQLRLGLDKYSEGKTEAILRILEAAGFRADELEMIARVNGRAV